MLDSLPFMSCIYVKYNNLFQEWITLKRKSEGNLWEGKISGIRFVLISILLDQTGDCLQH